jgi:hypothetical protein
MSDRSHIFAEASRMLTLVMLLLAIYNAVITVSFEALDGDTRVLPHTACLVD